MIVICEERERSGRKNLRVEKVGKRLDDWVITLESAIVNGEEGGGLLESQTGSEKVEAIGLFYQQICGGDGEGRGWRGRAQ